VWVNPPFPPPSFSDIFPKQLGIFSPNFTHQLCVPIYAGLQIVISLTATLTKLCHIKRDRPVHIIFSSILIGKNNRRVKFGLKIPNRLGEKCQKTLGDFFTHTVGLRPSRTDHLTDDTITVHELLLNFVSMVYCCFYTCRFYLYQRMHAVICCCY